jgi:hypothetical protein
MVGLISICFKKSKFFGHKKTFQMAKGIQLSSATFKVIGFV